MPCIACTVQSAPASGGWLVDSGEQLSGPYHSNDIAMRVALAQARALNRQGRMARLSVRDGGGDVIGEFCLCKKFRLNEGVR